MYKAAATMAILIMTSCASADVERAVSWSGVYRVNESLRAQGSCDETALQSEEYPGAIALDVELGAGGGHIVYLYFCESPQECETGPRFIIPVKPLKDKDGVGVDSQSSWWPNGSGGGNCSGQWVEMSLSRTNEKDVEVQILARQITAHYEETAEDCEAYLEDVEETRACDDHFLIAGRRVE